jgi:putative tryptophan/tyrosine transport system substrate-binding protein
MNRREFIAELAGAAAWPVAAGAQQMAPSSRIGVLGAATPANGRPFVAAIHRGLRETGFVEGRNLAIEYRWAEGSYDRLPELAAELVRRQPAAILTMGNTSSAIAAKVATPTIPIVFCIGADPVEFGLVKSLAKPTANLTGVTVLSGELTVKRIQLVHQMTPVGMSIVLLVNLDNPSARVADAELAARTLGVRLTVLNASRRAEIETAFLRISEERIGVLVVQGEPAFFQEMNFVVGLARRYGLPTIFGFREFVEAGGLMSYGADILDTYRIAGSYLGRILKGEKPTELPVQQSTKIELVINLKTAKALGLAIPEMPLATADEVIQ